MNADLRSYGGWRERRGFGLAGLSGTQTGSALAGVVLCLGVALIRPEALLLMAVPLAAIVTMVGLRVGGESLATISQRHGRFHWARRRGRLRHRSAESGRLPGVLAELEVVDATDAAGNAVGLLWLPDRRTLTAAVPLEPLGTELVDAEDLETWVCGWSDWLTHLGYTSVVDHVAVTVRTASTGQAARTVLSLTVGHVAASSLDRSTAALLDAVGGDQALGACGMSVLQALSASEIMTWVRQGYDPTATGVATAAADMRPTAVEEGWDSYRHDGWLSAVYAWYEPPGEAITMPGLARFLGPADYHKSVTVVFRPVPAHDAAREVETQAQAALFRREYRRRLGRDETARDAMDLRRARGTAEDHAAGAGVVDVALFAVASVRELASLAPAAADLENRAGEGRMRLRRCYGDQARGFACALGVGFLPARWW